jgi:hypothetical protein
MYLNLRDNRFTKKSFLTFRDCLVVIQIFYLSNHLIFPFLSFIFNLRFPLPFPPVPAAASHHNNQHHMEHMYNPDLWKMHK